MDISGEIQSQLPLTEATYFILLSLAPGPRHGYAIMKDVLALSHGRVTLSTGTLYTALKRQLDSGWIRRANHGPRADEDKLGTRKEQPADIDGRRRKEYNLTPLGRHILQAEVKRLEGLVSAAQVRPLNRIP
jgi:DNA-binding PadR family transcriptional regulator